MANVTFSNKAVNLIIILALAGMFFFAYMVQTGAWPLNRPNNPGSGLTVSNISMTAIVTYTDGSVRTFTPPEGMIPPLTILDPNGNKPVNNVEFDMSITAVYTGSLSSWSLIPNPSMGGYYYEICPLLSGSLNTPDASHPLWKNSATTTGWSGSSLTSGVSTKLAAFTITATTLQAMYTSWQANTQYYFIVAFPGGVSMTITFSDGTSQSQAASMASPSWNFNWQNANSFTSLSVTWQQFITYS